MSVMISGDMLPSPGGDHIPGSAPTSDNSLVNTDSQYQHLAPVIRHTGVISNGGLRSGARNGDYVERRRWRRVLGVTLNDQL